MNISDTIDAITKLAKASMTLDLQDKIRELREQVLELQDKNLELREEVQQLRKELEAYIEGAICPKCKEATLGVIESTRPKHGLLRLFRCSSCNYEEWRRVYEK